jgi:flagellar motor switch protein FliN/FliY
MAGDPPDNKTSAAASSGASDASPALSQGDIEALLSAGQTAAAPRPPAATAAATNAPAAHDFDSPLPAGDIELLLSHAERALASAQQSPATELPPGANPFKFDDFGGAPASTEAATIELLRDVELDLKIELGRTHMYLEDVLKLRRGSVVPLDKLAGDPVDIYVNGRLIARGEVLVLNDNFCVRVAELVTGDIAAAG